jgi:hypothetical protein
MVHQKTEGGKIMENNYMEQFKGATPDINSQTQQMVSRQTQEVQGAIFMAKQFPRDEYAAIGRIERMCERSSLAEQATYSYPRGGKQVTGPSIRLAEAIAQAWGNIDCGVIELENKNGASELMAYAWDLETNTRVTKMFKVKHVRDTKKGSSALTDSRDIYAATANFGARRLRACILSVIPGDVVERAVEVCKETVTNKDKTPIADRIKKLEKAFKELKITKEQLEEYAQRNLNEFGKEEIFTLQGVYKAIRDGQAKADDYFGKVKMDAPNIFTEPTKEPEIEVVDVDYSGSPFEEE